MSFSFFLRFVLVLCLFVMSQVGLRAVNAPTNISISFSNAGVLRATWSDTSNDERGFLVVFRTGTGSTSWTPITDLLPAGSTQYVEDFSASGWSGIACVYSEFTVVSVKAIATGDEYGFGSSTIMIAPPSPPTGSSCMLLSPSRISVPLNGTLNQALNVLVPQAITNRGVAPTSFALNANQTLPPGITYNATTRVLSGIPTVLGTWIVNFTALAGTTPISGSVKIIVTRTAAAPFRPVPEKVAPSVANEVPFVQRTLATGASVAVDLTGIYSDTDTSPEAVRVTTNVGSFDVGFYPGVAPITVANFKGYVTRGDMVNTIIHRSVPGFVIQGGGYRAAAGTPSITRQAPILNEPALDNVRGTLSMAKGGDDPNSATSEFFVNLADNRSNLNLQNEGFAVFGRIMGSGMSVVDGIAGLRIKNYGGVTTDCPVIGDPAAFDPAALVTVTAAELVPSMRVEVFSSNPAICAASLSGLRLDLVAGTPGFASILVKATDLDGLTAERTFGVTVNASYAQWVTLQGLGSAVSGPLQDPDGDGTVNFHEYAFAQNALQSDTQYPSVTVSRVAERDFLTIAFPMTAVASGAIAYILEASPDLAAGSWTPIWDSRTGAFVSETPLTSNSRLAKVLDPLPISSSMVPRFVRLRVQQ